MERIFFDSGKPALALVARSLEDDIISR